MMSTAAVVGTSSVVDSTKRSESSTIVHSIPMQSCTGTAALGRISTA
jgi:hypothetical protein